MIYFLIGAAGLHALFMVAELFPWRLPALLRIASKGLPKGEPFTYAQQTLVATIVHNAGIYNGILAVCSGLLSAEIPRLRESLPGQGTSRLDISE